MYSVQRYVTKHDANGNPRRVYIVRRGEKIITTQDEGYEGPAALTPVLQALSIPLTEEYGSWGRFDLVDLGDVVVSATTYREMVKKGK